MPSTRPQPVTYPLSPVYRSGRAPSRRSQLRLAVPSIKRQAFRPRGPLLGPIIAPAFSSPTLSSGPYRASNSSRATIFSKFAQGSYVQSVYPVHLTSTSRRLPRPHLLFSVQSILSTLYSALRSSVAGIRGGGWAFSITCNGRGSLAAPFRRSIWNLGKIPIGILSSTIYREITFWTRYLAFSQASFFEAYRVEIFLRFS